MAANAIFPGRDERRSYPTILSGQIALGAHQMNVQTPGPITAAMATPPGGGEPATARATSQQQAAPPRKERPSTPSLTQDLVLATDRGQKCAHRCLLQTLEYLFKCDVILYLISEEKEAKTVAGIIDKMLKDLEADLVKQIQMTTALLEANMVSGLPNYDKPTTVQVIYKTPRGPIFLGILRKLDLLVQQLDMAFMSGLGEFRSIQDEKYKWSKRILADSRRLMGITQRATAAAYAKGRGQEVIDNIGEGPLPEVGLDEEAEAGDVPATKRKRTTRRVDPVPVAAVSDVLEQVPATSSEEAAGTLEERPAAAA